MPDMEAPDAHRASRIFLRPIASPFALGFIGLAAASLILSGVELGWFGGAERNQAAIILIVFAPLVQLVASIFGFLARDPIAATGMGVLAATWLVIGLITLTTPSGTASDALGTFLLVSGAGLLAVSATAAQYKLLPAAVIALVATRFVLSAIFHISGDTFWQDLAGIVGLMVALGALVAAAVLEREAAERRPLAATMRRGDGHEALDGDLHAQTDRVAREAGVRKQL